MSMVPWFHRFRGLNAWFHGFIGFVVSRVSWLRVVSGFTVL